MIIQKPVSNYLTGRGRFKPQAVVIHVGEGSQNSIYQTFQTEPKSSHYCVSKTGEIWQFVQEADTAWSNGVVLGPTSPLVLSQPGINPNLYTISIEHEGFGTIDFTPEQYNQTSQLVREICQRWGIPIDRIHVLRHNEIRVDKTCPGIANVDKIVEMAKVGIVEPSKDEIKKQIVDLLGKL